MDLSSPASQAALSLLSPKAMEIEGCIIKFEQEQREKARVRHKHCYLSHNVNFMAVFLEKVIDHDDNGLICV